MKLLTHPSTLQRAKSNAALVGIALLAVVSLAGCVPEDQTPEAPASTSPTSSPAPQATGSAPADGPASSEEAIAAATAVLVEFNDLQNSISIEGTVDEAALDALAVNPARAGVVTLAEPVAGGQYAITGGITIAVTNAYTTDPTLNDGTVVPFGTALIDYCADTTTRTVTPTNGSTFPLSDMPVFMIEASVQYVPESGSWKVASTTGRAEAC